MTNRPGSLSVALAACACLALAACGTSIGLTAMAADKAKPAAASSKTKSTPAPKVAESKAKDAASSYDGPPVLDPSRYFGAAQMGYASAKAVPEVTSHLFCYCGCDITDSHHNLIDCFTSQHGVDCHICQEEAVEALKLKRAGKSIAEIQKQIDEDYSHHYPFQTPSANFKAYKASRLYTPADAGNGTVAGPEPADEKGTKEATAPKVKPGFTVGNCCKDDKQEEKK